ncbi:MAG: amidohydrolase family protein [Planctomycetota bacterium]
MSAGGRTIIRNGLVFDPQKRRFHKDDVFIEGNTIRDVAPGIMTDAAVIDVRGMVVAPGFIDVHGHSDAMPVVDCNGGSKLMDGVTTEIAGNCGFSLFPDREEHGPGKRVCPFTGGHYDLGASRFDDYLRRIDRQGMPLNMGFLIGHGKLREMVAGRANRLLDAAEIDRMRGLLDEHLAMGGLGLSLGLAYPPGCFAAVAEICPLAEAVKTRGGVVAAHIRSEGAGLVEALREFISVGERTGCRLQVSHLKAMWPKNWNKLVPVLEYLRERKAAGIDLTADRYPYTAASTNLDHLVPPAWYEGGTPAELARLADPGLRGELENYIIGTYGEDVFDRVNVVNLPHKPEWQKLEGMRVSAIAGNLGLSPFDAFVELNIGAKLEASAVYHAMSDDDLGTILKESFVCPGSDASYRSTKGVSAQGVPHPRVFGTFARYLGKYVREDNVLPLEEALYRVTLFPAERFNLKDRGRIARGFKADITIFDPDTIIDRATYMEPFQYSEGVAYVLVNGKFAVAEGKLTGARAGMVVRG